MKENPLTPESARKFLSLLNDYFRLVVPRIPKNQEPIIHAIETLEGIRKVPSNQTLSGGCDLTGKFTGLCMFIDKILSVVPESEVSQFLNEGVTDKSLTTQTQRMFNKLSLPRVLEKPPNLSTIRTAEKLKLALYEVIADWEALTTVIYGLVLFMDGEKPTWEDVYKIRLWDRVKKIAQNSDLSSLVKTEWVTVRNAIAHGKSIFVPSEISIKFPDKKRTISWTINECYSEAANIFLANQTILSTWNLVQTANLANFKERITYTRQLAEQ